MVTGPRSEIEEDGPDEFHLVIVDNGRSKLLADPHLREALYCIRCGACLNACPVYRKVGGHSYGWVYSGPIGAVVSPVLTNVPDAKDLPYASSLCGACKEACPIKIDLPRMLLYLRSEVTEGNTDPNRKKSSPLEKLAMKAWKFSVSGPAMLRLAGLVGRIAPASAGQERTAAPSAPASIRLDAPPELSCNIVVILPSALEEGHRVALSFPVVGTKIGHGKPFVGATLVVARPRSGPFSSLGVQTRSA